MTLALCVRLWGCRGWLKGIGRAGVHLLRLGSARGSAKSVEGGPLADALAVMFVIRRRLAAVRAFCVACRLQPGGTPAL